MKSSKAGQASVHELDVILSEVTPQMMLEGALILRGYAEKDPSLQGVSLGALSGMIYSRMRMVAPQSKGGHCRGVDEEAQKIARQLKEQIRQSP